MYIKKPQFKNKLLFWWYGFLSSVASKSELSFSKFKAVHNFFKTFPGLSLNMETWAADYV